MKKTILAALAAIALAAPASAAILSVSGPLSSAGVAAAKIGAPADVGNSGAGALGMLGFDELQGVTLGAALAVDGGFIAAGTVVDSHMIFLNRPDTAISSINHGTSGLGPVEWTFSGMILGVMSDNGGGLEAASNAILGAPGTSYPGGFINRGFEPTNPDFYTILSADTLGVGMLVSQPGDWIRVVTAPVPLPAAGWMLFAGLGALGWLSRRRAA